MIYTTQDKVFHLQTANTSYILRALPGGQIESMYFGKKIRHQEDLSFLFDKHECGYGNATPRSQDDTSLSLDHIALEYSGYGKGDYRQPAIQVTSAIDNFTTDFLFKSYFVSDHKPELHGLPSSYGDSQTLTLVLADKVLGAELHLFYTVFEDCNVITRSARLCNTGDEPFHIKNLMSMQLDLQRGDYTFLSFDGAWLRERFKHETPLTAGTFSIGSIAGYSSNRHNPFFAIKRSDCTENMGECYGFNLVYSGNHIARAEISTHGLLRIQNGINPFEFDWLLEPGKNFDTPESVLTFSADGLNGMSQRTESVRSWSTTGKRLTSSSTKRRSSASRRRPRTSAPRCSCSTTAGSASATTTNAPSAIGRSTAKCCPPESRALRRRSTPWA